MKNNEWLVTFLAEARRLRALSVEAECDFFQHLADGEESGMWRGNKDAGTGYLTFVQLLESEDLTKPHRYFTFKEAVAKLGFATVRKIGFEPSAMVLAIPDDAPARKLPGKPAYAAAVAALVESATRNGTTPSVQNSKAIIRSYYEPPPRQRSTPDVRVVELEKENSELRKEVRRLQRELAKAEAVIARFEQSSGARKAGPARTKKNGSLVAAPAA